MAVTIMRANEMWAQDFDDPHSYSVTVQVANADVFAEVALSSSWAAGEDHHAADIFITQTVSDSGVENYPTENRTGGDLVAVAFRRNMTSVTFKMSVHQAKGHGRWMLYYFD
jgi:hypothetical protein